MQDPPGGTPAATRGREYTTLATLDGTWRTVGVMVFHPPPLRSCFAPPWAARPATGDGRWLTQPTVGNPRPTLTFPRPVPRIANSRKVGDWSETPSTIWSAMCRCTSRCRGRPLLGERLQFSGGTDPHRSSHFQRATPGASCLRSDRALPKAVEEGAGAPCDFPSELFRSPC